MAKILFITTRLPYPANEGHQIRTYNLLKRICPSHQVHYLSLQRKDDDPKAVQHLETMCRSVQVFPIPSDHSKVRFAKDLLLGFLTGSPFVVRKYFSRELARAIEEKLASEQFDLVHFDMLPLAQYADLLGNVPYVLNNHNVESLLLKRRAENAASLPEKVFFSNQAKSLHQFEYNACKQAKETFVCSQVDADILNNLSPAANISVVENGVDTRFFAPTKQEQTANSLVFVGGMGWFPNKDGMMFFMEEVMPKILAEIPDTKLTLVGKSTGVLIPDDLQDNITVTGFVDDFRPIVAGAAVYILPIRVGSGTRLKLLEAMAMGKAIVSTSVGAEGINLSSDENIIYADDAGTFAQGIIALLTDREQNARFGHSARDLATSKYDWDIIANKLLVSYNTIITTNT
ncbi:glycosyltransferase family 4 protein [Thalassomonas haliotis]|uniref:Glycosyltransferase n=1 Tax=Thalassomonas haliotis TaxID=485448 RepID=A0ABY7VEY8_9GAMM|nr:glycosyltransferase family 4 protein [Thalassomonas haliotis]WDE12258.1 glycosyltransferase [Thalassomonas haliotis]